VYVIFLLSSLLWTHTVVIILRLKLVWNEPSRGVFKVIMHSYITSPTISELFAHILCTAFVLCWGLSSAVSISHWSSIFPSTQEVGLPILLRFYSPSVQLHVTTPLQCGLLFDSFISSSSAAELREVKNWWWWKRNCLETSLHHYANQLR
jgi:hypothetical protein